MFTDNDELSGLIASMMDASTLVILSNIDGRYNGSPNTPGAKVIEQVEPDKDISEYIQTEKSGFGRGGMITKYGIARKVADEGIRVIIANGKTNDILISLAKQPEKTLHTEFLPNPTPTSNVKKWIAHSESFAKGVVRVNEKAAEVLQSNAAKSLLLVGVTAIEGDFEEGDIVNIIDNKGNRIAIGRTSYSSDDARANIGQHDIKPLVHYDYLAPSNSPKGERTN